jgi:hypothetical protein
LALMMLRSVLAASLALLSGSASRPTDGTTFVFQLLDGRVLAGECTGLHDGQLVVHLRDGGSEDLRWSELLGLHAPPLPPLPPPTSGSGIEPTSPVLPPADDVLLLAGPDGDVLVGRVTGGDDYGLKLRLPSGAELVVPFELVARLLPSARLPLDRLGGLSGAGADDRLWLRRSDGGLDSLTGVVDRVAEGKVAFEGAVGKREFPLADVVAVVFGGAKPSDAPLAGLPVSVRLAGGSRLRAGLLELDGAHVALSTHLAPRLELPASALLSLVSRDKDRTLLADLVPAEAEEHPTVGGAGEALFPWRANLSVTGQLLSVGGVARATGLGVHAFSRLAFELPPGARSLRVTAGLCDEVLALPAAASIDVRVLVDGKPAAKARLAEGDAPAELRVDDLSGAKRLELIVGDGGDDDAGDRAAWVDGVILQGGD